MTNLQRNAPARLPLTEEDLAAIEARAAAATPGPWVECTAPPADTRQVYSQSREHDFVYSGEWVGSFATAEDVAFAVAARDDVPALLALVRHQATLLAEAEAEIARLREMLTQERERAEGYGAQLIRIIDAVAVYDRAPGDGTVAALVIDEIARLRAAAQQVLAHVDDVCDDVEQVLGKALGYPPAYPDASEVDDGRVCVGEHTPVALAREAATEITRLRAALADAPADY